MPLESKYLNPKTQSSALISYRKNSISETWSPKRYCQTWTCMWSSHQMTTSTFEHSFRAMKSSETWALSSTWTLRIQFLLVEVFSLWIAIKSFINFGIEIETEQEFYFYLITTRWKFCKFCGVVMMSKNICCLIRLINWPNCISRYRLKIRKKFLQSKHCRTFWDFQSNLVSLDVASTWKHPARLFISPSRNCI